MNLSWPAGEWFQKWQLCVLVTECTGMTTNGDETPSSGSMEEQEQSPHLWLLLCTCYLLLQKVLGHLQAVLLETSLCRDKDTKTTSAHLEKPRVSRWPTCNEEMVVVWMASCWPEYHGFRWSQFDLTTNWQPFQTHVKHIWLFLLHIYESNQQIIMGKLLNQYFILSDRKTHTTCLNY